jgi:hypothetical protein
VRGAFFVEGPSEREDVFVVGAVVIAGGEPATIVSSSRG